MEAGRRKPSIRIHPTAPDLHWRSGYLAALRGLAAGKPRGDSPVGLAPGNRKTGQTGSVFRSVFVWNLPAVATCPAASPWCLSRCYNADSRAEVFPIADWLDNWSWFMTDPERLAERICGQILDAEGTVAVRIHSSGDFFSVPYITFWSDIARRSAGAAFWAYTRSWADPALSGPLEALAALPNVHLFASWDRSMPRPPAGWRVSFVLDDPDDPIPEDVIGPSTLCPEQDGRAANCASCGICITARPDSIVFLLH